MQGAIILLAVAVEEKHIQGTNSDTAPLRCYACCASVNLRYVEEKLKEQRVHVLDSKRVTIGMHCGFATENGH